MVLPSGFPPAKRPRGHASRCEQGSNKAKISSGDKRLQTSFSNNTDIL